MNILTIVGARPQFIKAAPVSQALRARHREVLVHTGQHYDAIVCADVLEHLRRPEHILQACKSLTTEIGFRYLVYQKQ